MPMHATTRWCAAAASLLLAASIHVRAETIGSVDTTFRMVGANDSIEIEAFDDPKIEGVTCHLSRAVTGGVGKLIGTSVDTSDASIACRQIGPIRITEPLEDGERVFSERRSIIFKTFAGSPILRSQAKHTGVPGLLDEGGRRLAEEFHFYRTDDAVARRWW